jgi:hypothetical protein
MWRVRLELPAAHYSALYGGGVGGDAGAGAEADGGVGEGECSVAGVGCADAGGTHTREQHGGQARAANPSCSGSAKILLSKSLPVTSS